MTAGLGTTKLQSALPSERYATSIQPAQNPHHTAALLFSTVLFLDANEKSDTTAHSLLTFRRTSGANLCRDAKQEWRASERHRNFGTDQRQKFFCFQLPVCNVLRNRLPQFTMSGLGVRATLKHLVLLLLQKKAASTATCVAKKRKTFCTLNWWSIQSEDSFYTISRTSLP